MRDLVTLEVGGKAYYGWKRVQVTQSIKQTCSTFDIAVTETWKAFGERWVINVGDECVLKIDDQKVVTGFVDSYSPSIAGSDHTVGVTGRSLTGDLVDCSAVHSPGNFLELSIKDIASDLVKPFRCGLVVDKGVGLTPITKFELNQGESVFEAIERMARKQRLLLTCDVGGNLLLTTAGTKIYDNVVLDRYLSAEAVHDYRQRYSIYHAKAQQHGADLDPLDAAQVDGELIDNEVQRYRPIIIRPEGSTTKDDAQKRIIWQKNRDVGESLKVTLTLRGFHNSKGQLWKPNHLIWFEDEILGVAHQFLIVSVVFNKSESGTTTELELGLKSAFQQEPGEPELLSNAAD